MSIIGGYKAYTINKKTKSQNPLLGRVRGEYSSSLTWPYLTLGEWVNFNDLLFETA